MRAKQNRISKKQYEKINNEKRPSRGRAIARWFVLFITIAAVIVALSVRWMLATWSNMEMDELIFELTAPLEGTGGGMIEKYVLNCIVPALILWVILHFIYRYLLKKGRSTTLLSALMLCGAGAALAVAVYAFDSEVHFLAYLENQGVESSFVEEHYVNPAEAEIEFPEEKRNLIYIFMESTEVTFADEENGGAFPGNLLPNLTALAEENEDFAGSSSKLNGGISLSGTTWTIGAMFAETSGLPLKVTVGNNMDTMESFFPGLTTLGDILEDEGYDQTLMIGSDATFGGRRAYFTEHGNYNIQDYNYASENGLIPEGYKVWWGFEDERLFSFAKDTITEKAAGDAPFNVTILTVDTHFEDGYVCDICPDTYDDQYSNVFACADNQVSAFVEWCREQDWYENTTIIISGDHPTMDSDFCEDVSKDYQRKVYTCYLNAAAETDPSMGERIFSTFDDFPTTIAALGAKITGNRLGLGTNLFSTEPTLLEEYSINEVNTELLRSTSFLDSLENVDVDATEYRERVGLYPTAKIYMTAVEVNEAAEAEEIVGTGGVEQQEPVEEDKGETQKLIEEEESSETQPPVYEFDFRVEDLRYIDENVQSVYADFTYTNENGSKIVISPYLEPQEDGSFLGRVWLSQDALTQGSLRVWCRVVSGETYDLYSKAGDLSLCNRSDLLSYLSDLRYIDDYALLVAVKGDASLGLSDEEKAALEGLGFSNLPAYQQSYVGILENDTTLVNTSSDGPLSVDWLLSDGTSVTVTSEGINAGNSASFAIGEKSVAAQVTSGFTFVVYDETSHKVIDRYGYNPAEEAPSAKVSIYNRRPFSKKYTVTISDIEGFSADNGTGLKEMEVRIWDADTPTAVETFDLEAEGSSQELWSTETDLQDFKGKIWLDVVATDEYGRKYHVAKISSEIID